MNSAMPDLLLPSQAQASSSDRCDYFDPDISVKYCDQHDCVCMYVLCLCVRSHASINIRPKFTKFSINVTVAPLLGPPLTTM